MFHIHDPCLRQHTPCFSLHAHASHLRRNTARAQLARPRVYCKRDSKSKHGPCSNHTTPCLQKHSPCPINTPRVYFKDRFKERARVVPQPHDPVFLSTTSCIANTGRAFNNTTPCTLSTGRAAQSHDRVHIKYGACLQ